MFAARGIGIDYDERLLLANVNFSLSAGDVLHIQGGNGSGKTSLLKVLAGLSVPTSGEVIFNQQSITHYRAGYCRVMSYLGHKSGVHPAMTVVENLQSMTLAQPTTLSCSQAITAVQLSSTSCQLASELSAGQQRRLALAGLLMLDKPLWLLDEPFTALDAEACTLLAEIIRQRSQRGLMLVVSSHLALPFVMKDKLKVLSL